MKFKIQPKYLKAASLFRSSDATRYILTGIKVEADPDGITLISTDGRGLLVIRAEAEERDTEEPMEFIIPPEIIDGLPKPDQGYIQISCDGKKVRATGQTSVSKTAMDGNYPKWRQVVPGGNPRPIATLNFNLNFMGRFARAGEILHRSGAEIQIITNEDNGPLSVVPINSEANWFGVLMPCRMGAGQTRPAWAKLT